MPRKQMDRRVERRTGRHGDGQADRLSTGCTWDLTCAVFHGSCTDYAHKKFRGSTDLGQHVPVTQVLLLIFKIFQRLLFSNNIYVLNNFRKNVTMKQMMTCTHARRRVKRSRFIIMCLFYIILYCISSLPPPSSGTNTWGVKSWHQEKGVVCGGKRGDAVMWLCQMFTGELT